MDGRKLIAFCVILAGLFFLSSAYAWGPMSLGGMGGAAGTAGGAAGSDLDADFVLDTIGTNSYDFVSANDHYISIPDDDAWTSVKSASMWLTTDTLSFNARLLSRDNSSDVREWLFYFAGDDLRLIFFDEEGDTLGVTKDNVLEGQMWFNATFTWDGTTADSTGMKLYINGKDLGAVDQSSGTFGTVPNTALDLYIGHDNSVTYGHDGKIARTFLTSDVLTAEEIRSTMFAADCTAVAALIDNELECWDFSADTNADWNSNNGTAQPTGGTPVALAATPDYPGLTTSKYWIIEGQILDSEGSGVTVGSLTGYDNISPKLWITASELTITGNSSGDARGAVGPAVTRELGKTYFVDVETSVASFGYFGLDDTSSLDFSGEHMMRTDNSPVVLDYYSEATLHTGITPYVAAELAQYAFVIGGYDDGGVGIPWDNSEAAASYEYGVSVFQKGASIGNKWKLIWKDYVGSSASLYPQVQWVSSGAIGKIDRMLVPAATITGVIQPKALDVFVGTNGDNLVSGHTMDVGAGWTSRACLANEVWDIDTNEAEFETASDGSACADNDNDSYLYIDSTDADVFTEAHVTCVATSGSEHGLMFRGAADTVGGMNGWFGGFRGDGSACDYILAKHVDGVETDVASDTVGGAAGDYHIRCIADGTDIDCFVDQLSELAPAAQTDLQTETWVGIFTNVAGDKNWNSWVAYPRGTGDEYVALDGY